jgi:hypothetical protein
MPPNALPPRAQSPAPDQQARSGRAGPCPTAIRSRFNMHTPTLVTRFANGTRVLRRDQPLSEDQMRCTAPSILLRPSTPAARSATPTSRPSTCCAARTSLRRTRSPCAVRCGRVEALAAAAVGNVARSRRRRERDAGARALPLHINAPCTQVQENTLRDRLSGCTVQGRHMRTREVASIDRGAGSNRALWVLAEEMRRLKH